MNIYLKVGRKLFSSGFCIDDFDLELLHFYKTNNHDNEYQDCYGAFIKIQDLIENFADSLTTLVRNIQKIEFGDQVSV